MQYTEQYSTAMRQASVHLLELEETPREDAGSAVEQKSSTPPPPEEKVDVWDDWDAEEDGDVEVSFEELLRREKEFQAAMKARQAKTPEA